VIVPPPLDKGGQGGFDANMRYNKELTGLSFTGGEVLTSGDGVTKMIWKVCDGTLGTF